MILKETPWEKENIGINSSVEIYFDNEDKVETIDLKLLNDIKYEYQVAHVPVNNINLLHKLNSFGFRFFETKFELAADLKKFQINSNFERILKYTKIKKIENKEINEVYEIIRKGIFDTDKVSLDTFFGPQISGNRYVNWSKQKINSGKSEPYFVYYEDNKIGFFIIDKINDKTADSFLASLIDKDKYKGLGFLVLYYPMIQSKNMGFEKIVTGVSSNNIDSLKLHLALGYSIRNMNYTLIKHI